jgi:translation initiation factor 4G
LKVFFSVHNLDEAEVYFTYFPNKHWFQLVEKLVMSVLESKDSDAQLVAEFFDCAVMKELCAPSSFDEGFLFAADSLDDVAIDAPKAFNLMAIMLKDTGIDKDEEQCTQNASKSETPDRLLDMLA